LRKRLEHRQTDGNDAIRKSGLTKQCNAAMQPWVRLV
jgi:hypothetical protein